MVFLPNPNTHDKPFGSNQVPVNQQYTIKFTAVNFRGFLPFNQSVFRRTTTSVATFQEGKTTRHCLAGRVPLCAPVHAVITSFGMQCACSAGVGRVQSVFLLGPLPCSASQLARACPLDSSSRRRSPGPLSPSVRFLTDASRRAPTDEQWRFWLGARRLLPPCAPLAVSSP